MKALVLVVLTTNLYGKIGECKARPLGHDPASSDGADAAGLS